MNVQNWLIGLAFVMLASDEPKPKVDKALLSRLERVAAVKQIDWVLDRTVDAGSHVTKIWKLRKAEDTASAESASATQRPPDTDQVIVETIAYPTADQASDELRKSIRMIAAPFSGSLDNLGDEAYLWANYGPQGASAIRLRRGNLVFGVTGPTLDAVKGFAETMVEGVDAYTKEVRDRTGKK